MGRSVARFRVGLTIFLGAASVLGGGFFILKLVEFINSLEDKSILGFAIAPLVNYSLVAAGFFALLIWAFLAGQFSHVEETKADFLADQERYDKEDSHLQPGPLPEGGRP